LPKFERSKRYARDHDDPLRELANRWYAADFGDVEWSAQTRHVRWLAMERLLESNTPTGRPRGAARYALQRR
jgi:hypothetical protein